MGIRVVDSQGYDMSIKYGTVELMAAVLFKISTGSSTRANHSKV